MKVICPRESLLSACQLASVAIPTRTAKPILMNLKAIAEDERFTIMATDTEIGVRLVLRTVQVIEGGEAILPAKRIIDILRESVDETLTVEADETKCNVLTASGEFEMPGANADEFPDVPTFGATKFIELTAGELREMIRLTQFAAAKESLKYAMQGVLWEPDGKYLNLVATDSKRLAKATCTLSEPDDDSGRNFTYLVPTKVMNLLERHLQGFNDANAKVRVCLRPNEVLFETEAERATIYSRLLEGRFPPYRDIIPKKTNIKVDVPAEAFLAVLRQAAVMTDSESKRVNFSFTTGLLTMTAESATSGRSKVQLKIEYNDKPLNIKFDPTNLVEMLRLLEGESILQIDLIDSVRPAVFRFGDNYIYLVMPMS
jgi:DNA polymerase-3 subunit beta